MSGFFRHVDRGEMILMVGSPAGDEVFGGERFKRCRRLLEGFVTTVTQPKCDLVVGWVAHSFHNYLVDGQIRYVSLPQFFKKINRPFVIDFFLSCWKFHTRIVTP